MTAESQPPDGYEWNGVRIASLVPSSRSARSAAERRVAVGGARLDRLPIEAFAHAGIVTAHRAAAELGRLYEILLVPEGTPEALRAELSRLSAIPVLERIPVILRATLPEAA